MNYRVIVAYSVHIFTSLGAIFGFWAILAIVNNEMQAAFSLMLAAFAVDSVDGTLARAVDVRKWTPRIKGEYLDLVIDFLNFVFVPAFLFYYSAILPEGIRSFCVCLVLLSGCYNYGLKVDSTPDGYFLGFPAAWHFVGFFLYLFAWPAYLNVIVVVFLFILHFVPVKIIYLTKNVPFPRFTYPCAAIVLVLVVLAIAILPERSLLLNGALLLGLCGLTGVCVLANIQKSVS